MTETTLTIPLPSLIHRIGGMQTKALKMVATQHQCELKRVRRSRNWQLQGEALHIEQFYRQCQQQSPDTLKFVINKIAPVLAQNQTLLEPLADKLQRLLREQPNLTLSELMAQTQCTVQQARQARFAVEE
ncbi:ribosome recycling factor [Vibrio sp. CAIM 722]|uniref:Ribosome recycling factor n=1 Tax=Vibrio eleionomae TaxID=2653505 RepID=A0A7X4RU94_9VIBR|nr:ribosome recycling factor family protein [Vibrio eleionomae]MZI93055.1 ribosome recycling factor [Vibrio eleionomae]